MVSTPHIKSRLLTIAGTSLLLCCLAAPTLSLAQDTSREEEDARLMAEYIKEARRSYGYHVTDSGLLFLLLNPGKGSRPTPNDRVTITMTALAPDDGKTVLPHLSLKRGTIAVKDLLPGLAEAVQMMAVGTEARVLLTPNLSFGKGPWPAQIEPGSPMIFHLALHEVHSARPSPP